VSDCADLAGSFDSIIAIDSLEHYLEPVEVLENMRRLLKPSGGVVLVYFSQPWLHPYGAHCREMTAFPWIQFFFSERAVMTLRSEYFSEYLLATKMPEAV
jgi:2-polyprenyl-3-methyl-5-hydroxy-6-metoxy-1,4-benzoquinol methylase